MRMEIRSNSKNPFVQGNRIAGLLFILAVFCIGCEPDPKEDYLSEITEFASPKKGTLPLFYGRDLLPVWEIRKDSSPRGIQAFRMKDQGKTEVSESFCKDKITIVSFFFTRCSGICPTITNHLSVIQKRFEKNPEVNILSFSATPDLDTPEVLREYAAKRKIRYEKWRLLTGESEKIYRLARESFNADTPSFRENAKKKLTEKDFLHSDHVYLLDGELRLRGIYNGKMRSAMEELSADIETLKREDPFKMDPRIR